ncbi:MAG: translation initiation factor IF-2 [Candidatus Aminicenantes bacterium]|nr:translation initiation factor IF-2 [Candidatus Aminicenantes bacterium]
MSEKGKSKEKKEKKTIQEGMNLKELTDLLDIKAKGLIEKLSEKGLNIGVNDEITGSLAQDLSDILNMELEIVPVDKMVRLKAKEQTKELKPKPPVVSIMGHVDHGKTTLLDAIRESNLVNKESGGITQHIGAYRISYKNKHITFVDTPGHEAFTQLRSRGAKVTDIVVLVVAADDGVMPQTKEAIDHARAADVPIIVAINKIDRTQADIDATKQQLSKQDLLVEDWGGDTICVEISAKEKKNLEDLLDMILLLSEMLEITANPKVSAQGIVLEASLDTSKGPVATVIIQQGKLTRGEAFVCGTTYGKARAMFDEKGHSVKEAEISMPVEILGFCDVPVAGDFFQVLPDLDKAKRIANFRLLKTKKTKGEDKDRPTLDQLFKDMENEEKKTLPLILKTDVQGSVEVLNHILPNLSTDKVNIDILHSSTGKISESDVSLASTANAIIIGYNTKPNKKTQETANAENVEIRTYKVIYELTDDIKKALQGMLEPVKKEVYQGRAEVKRTFKIKGAGIIAGCLVQDGVIHRNSKIKLLRNDEIIHEGTIASLKHLKKDVTEIKKGYECGINIQNFKDIKEGDTIEAYTVEEAPPK